MNTLHRYLVTDPDGTEWLVTASPDGLVRFNSPYTEARWSTDEDAVVDAIEAGMADDPEWSEANTVDPLEAYHVA